VDFDKQHKFIYEVHTDEKIVGLGESYRGTDERLVQENCKRLTGQHVMKFNWRQLPLPYNRAYDGFITQPHRFLRERDGVYLAVPQGPGLGVELDRRALAAFRAT